MIEGFVARRPQWTTAMGGGLIAIGLVMFMVVFAKLLPILTDPNAAYDAWFPAQAEAAEATATPETPARPTASFTWEAVAVESVAPAVYRLRLESTSEPAESALVAWQWDFGDGAGDEGRRVEHDYATHGAYLVTLTVLDEAGRADTVAGEVAIPGVAATIGGAGRIDGLRDPAIDGSLEEAFGAVGAEIRSSLDGAVGSIGASARGAVVVFLFILAAFATTVVAWRVARVGVMVLNGAAHPGAPFPVRPRPVPDDHLQHHPLERV